VKAFDGVHVLEPRIVYLKPMHEDPQLSWFDTTGNVVLEEACSRPNGEPRIRWLASIRARLPKRISRSVARHDGAPPAETTPAPPPEPAEGPVRPCRDVRKGEREDQGDGDWAAPTSISRL
jgi:hypothetical protein